MPSQCRSEPVVLQLPKHRPDAFRGRSGLDRVAVVRTVLAELARILPAAALPHRLTTAVPGRLAPITDADAHEMIRELRSAPPLLGYRGAAPADVAAVEDLLQRIGTLADEIPEIAELDLNPVIVRTDGLLTVDAKIRVTPSAPTTTSCTTR